ncbi:MAG: transcriptional repressor [Treponema sp.]|jgi:Fur family ferric uptake transcriptional regulator|nr:transcriptional repressor [Treponema sp.]
MEHTRPANYNTRQRQQILDYLSSVGDAHVTASQIARHFADSEGAIGQTTIYRHLEKLVNLGSIRKYALNDGEGACYQYVTDSACHEHFHLKCEQCGQLIHLDCELLDEIEQHLVSEHEFQINALKTVLYGRCGKCREDVSV